jgi:hypothetical protein
MQPGATELLNGIKQIIFNIFVPELQTEQARAQAMYSSVLIEHLIARWEIEVPQLLEERAELRALLTQALAVVADEFGPRIREALAAAESGGGGPKSINAENERMRALVPAIARALPPDSAAHPMMELDAAIRSYIRNQHRRDQAMVLVGGLAW